MAQLADAVTALASPTCKNKIMTLEFIKSHTEEYGECHIWQRSVNADGYPQMTLSSQPHKLVRRIVFALAGGHLNSRQPVITTCGEKLYVNPDHLKTSTTAKVAQAAARRGAYSGIARASKIAAAKRKCAKLTMEIAKEIRMSSESGPTLAARYGVNRALIVRIKSGKAWRDFSNPYIGLMA